MFDSLDGFLIGAITSLPGIIIAMVIHEWAHARVAYALGDFTPKLMGRLTLNPAAHIDILGLVMLFIAHFGWAKPVQIFWFHLRDRAQISPLHFLPCFW